MIGFGKTESLVGRIQLAVIRNTNKMKNIIYTFLILFIGISSSAQEEKNKDIKTEELSHADMNYTNTIYLLGGIASVITKEDIAFAKKYNIQFHDFGCLAPANMEKYEKLNAQVFEQLNKEFGTNWQKEIRKGILGFEKWKKS